MRTSIAGATFLLVGAGAVAVGAAVDTTGNNIALGGSDTLFEVTRDVITGCPNAVADGISYEGGGSGVGASAMQINTQQVSPMSRNLKSGEYCGVSLDLNGDGVVETPTQGTTEALLVGLDGIAIVSNTTTSCAGNGLGMSGNSFSVVDGSGAPVVNCHGCTSGTSTYALQSSIDALRLIYGGFHHDGSFDCNGDVRKSLANSWGKLFASTCADGTCAQLSHAWRRSDLSGTTDAFSSLVGFGNRGIGTVANVPFPSKKQNHFCNSTDANAAAGQSCAPDPITGIRPACPANQGCDTAFNACFPVSFGGSSDFSDADPIRRPCGTNDQVCEADGTLGLVLPMLPPDVATTATDKYPTQACDLGAFDLQSTGSTTLPCPGGPLFFGKCFQPYHLRADGTFDFQCIAAKSAKAFGTPSGIDGRAWNLPVKKPSLTDTTKPAAYLKDANNRFMTASFFRIHTTKSTFTGGPTCQLADATQQIGCLVSSDPCSIGFAGREAASQPGAQSLLVNNIPPTDINVQNLVTGGSPVYPIARRLFFATLVGFGNLKGGELELAKCYADNTTTKQYVLDHGFIPLPSPGIQCIDYDETLSTSASPFPGCASASNTNACAVSPPTILHPY